MEVFDPFRGLDAPVRSFHAPKCPASEAGFLANE
jgi:hypothetical protein